ncbi:MAG: hypothetical protein LBD78_08145, partial [Spirochaetaceae bacterium]|nr:hypothetical protein [Spirochaetaceae bacterium]
ISVQHSNAAYNNVTAGESVPRFIISNTIRSISDAGNFNQLFIAFTFDKQKVPVKGANFIFLPSAAASISSGDTR